MHFNYSRASFMYQEWFQVSVVKCQNYVRVIFYALLVVVCTKLSAVLCDTHVGKMCVILSQKTLYEVDCHSPTNEVSCGIF